MLIFDQRSDLAAVKYDQAELLNLFDELHEKAEALPVRKEQAEKLRDEILNNYVKYREAIIKTYSNAEKGVSE